MIICVCNGLPASACREVAASGRCRGVQCIYRALGCRVRCGRCVPMMREVLAAHAPPEAGGSAPVRIVPAAPER